MIQNYTCLLLQALWSPGAARVLRDDGLPTLNVGQITRVGRRRSRSTVAC